MAQYEHQATSDPTNNKDTTSQATSPSKRSVLELQESSTIASGGEGKLHLLIPDRWISLDILAQANKSKIKVQKVTEADFAVHCPSGGDVEIGSVRAITASVNTGREGGLRGGELSGSDVNVTSGSMGIRLRRLVALRGSVVGTGASSVTSIGSIYGDHLNVSVDGPMRVGNMSCQGSAPTSLLSSVTGPIVVEGMEGHARVMVEGKGSCYQAEGMEGHARVMGEGKGSISLHLQGKCGSIEVACGDLGQGEVNIALGPEALPLSVSVDGGCSVVKEGGREEWREEVNFSVDRTMKVALFEAATAGGGSEALEDRGRGRGGLGNEGSVTVYRARQLNVKRMSWMEALKKKMSLKAAAVKAS